MWGRMKDCAEIHVKAVIYCRVSTDRQFKEGDGLKSQEKSCYDYAERKGYKVIKVFRDEGVSGAIADWPAVEGLLEFLTTQRQQCVVIVDDITRLARKSQTHWHIRAEIKLAGGILESPNMKFGDEPEDIFIETIMAGVSELHRNQNARQVKNRQKARLLNGYWVFPEPPGYKYAKDTGGGKIMVRDEPQASVVAEAFEGFATGRFENQADIAHFITKSGAFSLGPKERFYPTAVKTMLTNILYTGYLEYRPWEVPLVEGKHSALIGMDTYLKIQEKLGRKAKAPYRKDLNEDFPLRGFVLCACCNEPVTSGWSTGRNGKHAYYHCKTKGCRLYGKSIKRDMLEGQFKDILKAMTPSDIVIEIARDVIEEGWKKKRAEYLGQRTDLDREKKQIDHQIDGFMGRLLEEDDRTIISLYKNHIKELEMKRQMLSAQAKEMYKVDTTLEGAFRTVFDFIRNPLSWWENGDMEDKRMVLKLAFAKRVAFSKDDGFRTAEYSLPFSVLQGSDGQKSKMVEETGFEPVYACAGRFTVCCH